jgi:hypothetical protein
MPRPTPLFALASFLVLVACQKKEEEAPPLFEPSREASAPMSYEAGMGSADRMVASVAPGSSTEASAPQRQFVRSADLRFRTRSVESATRSIQAIVARHGGFVELDDLRSTVREERTRSYGSDSLLAIYRVDVTNTLSLRVPNDRLDTVLALVSPLVAFLDHRTVRAQDVGMELRRAERERQRMERAQRRVLDLIDESTGKLKDKTTADEQAQQREDRAAAAADQRDNLLAQVELSSIQIALYQHPETRQDTLERPLHEIWREPYSKRLARSLGEGWDSFVSFVLWVLSNWFWWTLFVGALVLFLRRRRTRSGSD